MKFLLKEISSSDSVVFDNPSTLVSVETDLGLRVLPIRKKKKEGSAHDAAMLLHSSSQPFLLHRHNKATPSRSTTDTLPQSSRVPTRSPT
ncbi:hypothetical protein EAG_07656 [Camponotus floridanus]|uniref:Uncharacterized protein n=1 Tax=Camponotus floridanus TaxID=104421 RepID=E2AND9_CAMFO|nr:hypothetical protein EAG_07656 [Camponotus floridanus]